MTQTGLAGSGRTFPAHPVAALVLGALVATGQAPWGLWFVALPALALLTLMVAGVPGPRRAAVLMLAAGTGHFGLALSWIVEPFLIDVARHGWMAPFALVLMAVGMGLFWAAAGAVAARLRGRAARAIALAAALSGAEALRGVVLTGFPWAQPGHVLIDTPMAQAAVMVGPNGLTMILLLIAALPVALGPRVGMAGALAAVAALWIAGAARLAGPVATDDGAPVLRLVQPNAEQSLKWDPDLARLHFDRLLTLTRAAPDPAIGAPELVIWPETAVPYLLDRAPNALWEIARAGAGVPVATGIQRSDGGWRYWNSLAVITTGGQVSAVYDKHHLVPFGEYVPFGDALFRWFGIAAFAAQEGHGYSAGPAPALLDLGGRLGRALPLICYEAVFPQAVRAAPGRPDWIMQVTNDAWFGTVSGPYQHLAQARLRAIEQGLPLVRAANTGVSAVIDARGRVLGQIALGQGGHLDLPLPPALGPTVFARWGDLPFWCLLSAMFAAAIVWSRRAGT